jgi:virginiamycin B lyase
MNPNPFVVRDNQYAQPSQWTITEFAIAPPDEKPHKGSTHEITYNPNSGDALWITQPDYDFLVKAATDGKTSYYSMPADGGPHGPHGIQFDGNGQLWVALEYAGKIAKLDGNGKIVAEYNARLECSTCAQEINTHPHGLGIGGDGETIWFSIEGDDLCP